jgi:hypothetical protein
MMTRTLFVVFSLLCLGAVRGHATPLPSRDPQVVVPLLRAFHEHEGFGTIERILGRPDTDIGSAYSITVFRLEDGTSVYVKATPSRNRVFAITRSHPGALAQTLYEPLGRYLDHPQPHSAPF